MNDMLIMPRDVVQRAYDALEELPDYSDPSSEIFILYHQLGTFLYPDPRFVTPVQTLQTDDPK